ncbi:hypothetical protein KR093_004710 [Drosophila rubida]|uniref:Osiris 6 n=1 Tax=Drosophila rubida TaxID=30044 RepID=A0AAD4JT43_9MUSC|nr:hypothetical protein KR093_004710 [Drosophila rubida]
MSPVEAIVLLLSVLHFQFALSSDLSLASREELQQFKQCVRGSQRSKLSECLGRSALNFIQRFDEHENVTFVDDFVAVKSETAASRSLVNVLDTDPVDFRGILENAGAVMGQRSLEWHMDALYPGLMFKIGPTADANSVAEFVLDAGAHDERQFGYDEGTGRLLAKQYLLPFLLGLKFNLVALVPLLFAGICLLLKKSLFLAKLAIYVSSFLGLGGVLGTLGGGFGGLGGLGGGFGGFSGANFGYGGAFAAQRPIGHFPGKTTVFGNGDELHHQYNVQEPQPYKRSDRKVRFEQPREEAASTQPKKRLTDDRFYDYEKQHRQTKSLEETISSADSLVRNFQDTSPASNMNGWQIVDCLGAESERLLEAATLDNNTWHLSEYLSIEPQQATNDSQNARTMKGLAGKLLQLAQGRALRMRLPRQITISNAIDEFGDELGLDQGRKKKDKDKHMAMMGGMIMLATFAQMFLGKVILIAGSAFIMAKIALLISLLVSPLNSPPPSTTTTTSQWRFASFLQGSLKKGTTGHSGSSDHVIVTNAGATSAHSHESGWHRSMPTHSYSPDQLEAHAEDVGHGQEQAYYAYEMDQLNRRHLAAGAGPTATTTANVQENAALLPRRGFL